MIMVQSFTFMWHFNKSINDFWYQCKDIINIVELLLEIIFWLQNYLTKNVLYDKVWMKQIYSIKLANLNISSGQKPEL